MSDVSPVLATVQQEDVPKHEPKNDMVVSSNTTEIVPIEIHPIVENSPSNQKAAPKSNQTKKSKTVKDRNEEALLAETSIPTQEQEDIAKKSTMAEEKSTLTVKTAVGEDFMTWLKNAIENQKLIINEPQALIHNVEDTLYLVTPGIFMRYSQEHPELQSLTKAEKLTSWRYVQRSFEKMKAHKKQPDGLNIWTCSVQGPRSTKKVHGYLLAQPQSILPDVLFNNPYLTIMQS